MNWCKYTIFNAIYINKIKNLLLKTILARKKGNSAIE